MALWFVWNATGCFLHWQKHVCRALVGTISRSLHLLQGVFGCQPVRPCCACSGLRLLCWPVPAHLVGAQRSMHGTSHLTAVDIALSLWGDRGGGAHFLCSVSYIAVQVHVLPWLAMGAGLLPCKWWHTVLLASPGVACIVSYEAGICGGVASGVACVLPSSGGRLPVPGVVSCTPADKPHGTALTTSGLTNRQVL
jgi:hypothetical protein